MLQARYNLPCLPRLTRGLPSSPNPTFPPGFSDPSAPRLPGGQLFAQGKLFIASVLISQSYSGIL